MAAKKVTMGTKPGRTATTANVDDWVQAEPTKSTAVAEPVPVKTKPPIKMKRLTLDIPEPLHKAIKTRSVQEGVAMVDMLRELLNQHYGVK
jgi:predicted DNA binding CopG/RHH family protein